MADTTIAVALSSTIKMLQYRIREAALAREYDPALITRVRDSTMLAAGGGASAFVGTDHALRMPAVTDPGFSGQRPRQWN